MKTISSTDRRGPSTGIKRVLATAVGATTALAGIIVPAVAANAAEDVITVTNTANCDTPGSLESALIAANTSTNPDGVKIVFDASLAGTGGIVFPGSVCKMYSGFIGAAGGNYQAPGTAGARFLIDATVPVSIDFTNLDEISTTTDADFAGIYVKSDDVTLSNLPNLKAGAAGIAISGSRVTVDNVGFSDPDSAVAETGVAVLDGASDVTIRDSSFTSQWWSSILIDSSVSNPATVGNIVVDNITSRGVESGIGHIDIEDGATVNGLTVRNSSFGVSDEETSTSHAVYLNTALTVNDLDFSGNTVVRGAGAEKNVFYFENATGSTFNDTTIAGNTFSGVSKSQPLSRIIGSNNATWNNLRYADNTATATRGILMGGQINGGAIEGNTFTGTLEPNGATIQITTGAKDVSIADNVLDTVWSIDAIRVQGTAENVVIENNTVSDFTADVSRSAIALIASGENNIVRGNDLVQHLERAGVDLPATLANHWAVYVWAEASAAAADATVGWSIVGNHIDGFGGNPAISSQAPITDNAIGKTLITGNTFGAATRGSFETETENGGNWFVWNDHAAANNRVQTFRAEAVRYDGANATFTATQPDALAGNKAAAAPVTLHVYWTADNHAEEYLGSLDGVTAGSRVTIPTTHTTGYLRVQTVDANGYTSQYSSIDKTTQVIPAAPAVTSVTTDTATGTGSPAATIEVRDGNGKPVGTAVVAADGSWTVTDLACGTDYTAVQIVGGVESSATTFRTADCTVEPVVPAAPVVKDVTGDTVTGTGTPDATVEVRDGDGKPAGSSVVAPDGSWTVSDLDCGTDYTAVQIIDGTAGPGTAFRTADCAVEPVTPAAPTVTEVTKDKVGGTASPGSFVTIRDADGNVVVVAIAGPDGGWSVDASQLLCGADYTATQTVDGIESAATSFSTVACAAPGGGNLPSTGSDLSGGLVGLAGLLLAAGVVTVMIRRRALHAR